MILLYTPNRIAILKCFSFEEREKPHNSEKFLLKHRGEPTTNSMLLTRIILFLKKKDKEIYGTKTRIIWEIFISES